MEYPHTHTIHIWFESNNYNILFHHHIRWLSSIVHSKFIFYLHTIFVTDAIGYWILPVDNAINTCNYSVSVCVCKRCVVDIYNHWFFERGKMHIALQLWIIDPEQRNMATYKINGKKENVNFCIYFIYVKRMTLCVTRSLTIVVRTFTRWIYFGPQRK